MNVVVCSDERTLGGLIATVNSIWLNTKSHVKFHIVVDKNSLLHLRYAFKLNLNDLAVADTNQRVIWYKYIKFAVMQ